MVCTAADGEGTSTREFIRFITLVLKNRREGYLQFIGLMYLDLYRKLKHIGVGKLITAVDVDKRHRIGFVLRQRISCMRRWSWKR